jgi:hypothetical protein
MIHQEPSKPALRAGDFADSVPGASMITVADSQRWWHVGYDEIQEFGYGLQFPIALPVVDPDVLASG